MSIIHSPSFRLSMSGTRTEVQEAVAWLFNNVEQFEVRKLVVAADPTFPQYDGSLDVEFADHAAAAKFKLLYGDG